MWFIGVEVEKETSAPPPKENPGSAPGIFDAENILSKFAPRLKTIIIWITTTLITSDKKFCIL